MRRRPSCAGLPSRRDGTWLPSLDQSRHHPETKASLMAPTTRDATTHAQASQRHRRHAPERLERARRHAPGAAEALHQALEAGGWPAPLVRTIAGRFQRPPPRGGPIVGGRFPARWGCRPPSEGGRGRGGDQHGPSRRRRALPPRSWRTRRRRQERGRGAPGASGRGPPGGDAQSRAGDVGQRGRRLPPGWCAGARRRAWGERSATSGVRGPGGALAGGGPWRRPGGGPSRRGQAAARPRRGRRALPRPRALGPDDARRATGRLVHPGAGSAPAALHRRAWGQGRAGDDAPPPSA